MSIFAAIIVVTNIGFTAAYDTSIRNPRWVAYDLLPNMVIAGERRPFGFRYDPKIGDGSDASRFYASFGSTFDRGHLCPSADMCWSTNAQRETFYFSNVAPQYRRVNRGVWRETEEEVRRIATSGTVHVVIVPLDFTRVDATNGVWYIPSRFVKIAYGTFGARYWNIENTEQKQGELK